MPFTFGHDSSPLNKLMRWSALRHINRIASFVKRYYTVRIYSMRNKAIMKVTVLMSRRNGVAYERGERRLIGLSDH
jgi:hypothetical protein